MKGYKINVQSRRQMENFFINVSGIMRIAAFSIEDNSITILGDYASRIAKQIHSLLCDATKNSFKFTLGVNTIKWADSRLKVICDENLRHERCLKFIFTEDVYFTITEE